MKQDIIFDFVITEDSKYMIFMDEVYSNKSEFSLGSIWDNTYIFNEILKNKLPNQLNEDIRRELNIDITKINWDKQNIEKWLKDPSILSEDNIWTQAVNKITDLAGDTLKNLFLKGIVPALRWYRKNTQNIMGSAADAFFSLFPATAPFHKGMWLAIIALDIYEMITNDYDEVSRDMPILNLIMDIATFLFSKAATGAFSAFKTTKSVPPKYAKVILDKLPVVTDNIRKFINAMSKNVSGTSIKKFISTTLNGLDEIIKKVVEFLNTQVGKEVARGVGSNVAVNTSIAAGAAGISALNNISDEEKMKLLLKAKQNIGYEGSIFLSEMLEEANPAMNLLSTVGDDVKNKISKTNLKKLSTINLPTNLFKQLKSGAWVLETEPIRYNGAIYRHINVDFLTKLASTNKFDELSSIKLKDGSNLANVLNTLKKDPDAVKKVKATKSKATSEPLVDASKQVDNVTDPLEKDVKTVSRKVKVEMLRLLKNSNLNSTLKEVFRGGFRKNRASLQKTVIFTLQKIGYFKSLPKPTFMQVATWVILGVGDGSEVYNAYVRSKYSGSGLPKNILNAFANATGQVFRKYILLTALYNSLLFIYDMSIKNIEVSSGNQEKDNRNLMIIIIDWINNNGQLLSFHYVSPFAVMVDFFGDVLTSILRGTVIEDIKGEIKKGRDSALKRIKNDLDELEKKLDPTLNKEQTNAPQTTDIKNNIDTTKKEKIKFDISQFEGYE